jgi:hypothetical protein
MHRRRAYDSLGPPVLYSTSVVPLISGSSLFAKLQQINTESSVFREALCGMPNRRLPTGSGGLQRNAVYHYPVDARLPLSDLTLDGKASSRCIFCIVHTSHQGYILGCVSDL